MRTFSLHDIVASSELAAQAANDNGPTFELATIDYIIVGLYIVGILAIGFWVGRKKQSSEDFLLGGRIAIWPLVGFGLRAANMPGTSYIGIAGAGYEEGIAVWNYEWMATLVLLFFALFVLPFSDPKSTRCRSLVMITDTIQGVLLLLAGTIIFVTLFVELGSWDAIRQAAPEDGWTVAPPSDDEFLPWPGIFTGVL